MTPADLLARAGRALYGEHFIAPLAHELGMGKDTLRGMVNGKSSIRPATWDRIEVLLAGRGEAVRRVEVELAEFRAAPKGSPDAL